METKIFNDFGKIRNGRFIGKDIMKTIISLIIPVYNAEHTLDRCINSIQKQTFQKWEMILIDDGSDDNSAAICDKYTSEDTRIHVIHQKNKGASAARNAGISKAQGEYLMFIDSDDTIGSFFLEKYITAIHEMKADVVIGGYTLIKESGERVLYNPTGNQVFCNEIWEKICENPQPFGYLWNKIFKMDIVKKWNLALREDMYSQEDLDFCISYFDKCYKFGIIQNIDYQYYYIEGKRIPPVWNFIENQLKLIDLAQKRYRLSSATRKKMSERINLLIYTFIYDAEKQGTYRKAIERLDRVEGLRIYLKCISVYDEKSFICYEYLNKRYKFIYFFLKCRRIFRNMIRGVRYIQEKR